MSPEGFCSIHGPFDGPACPYPHGESRPQNPTPLGNDDDAPTDLGGGGGYSPGYGDAEAPTEIPGRRQGILDADDAEATDIGRGARDDVTELESPQTVTLAMLWVKEGRRRGKYYPIRHGTVVGRKEGGLILDDPKVSSMHAKFNLEGADFVVWDFGSANGTFVNGKRIREAYVLEENDEVRIGETLFVVKLLDSKPHRKKPAVAAKKAAVKKPAAKKKTAKK
jgi:hypothetical protein